MRSADRKTPSEGKGSGPGAGNPATPEIKGGTPEVKGGAGGVLARRAVAAEEDDEREAEPGGKLSRSARKRPCFQCGTMTPVSVLEKTGDLCYRCYRPAGYRIVRTLLLLAALSLLAGGAYFAWKTTAKTDDGVATTPDTSGPKERPKEFTAEQKVNILKRHLMDGVSISDLCRTFGVEPGEYKQWEQMFFQAGERAFDPVIPREAGSVERRIATIEQKIQMAGKVLAELRENVGQLRKEAGHYDGTPAQKFILDSVGPPPREK